MQSLFSLFAKSSSTRTARAQKPATQAGPQELDAHQLQQVSGGLPKGGWGAPATSTSGDNRLPKGGW